MTELESTGSKYVRETAPGFETRVRTGPHGTNFRIGEIGGIDWSHGEIDVWRDDGPGLLIGPEAPADRAVVATHMVSEDERTATVGTTTLAKIDVDPGEDIRVYHVDGVDALRIVPVDPDPMLAETDGGHCVGGTDHLHLRERGWWYGDIWQPCIRCGGDGRRVECVDDLCHAKGRCMHGDNTCNLCGGIGRISHELADRWREREPFEAVTAPDADLHLQGKLHAVARERYVGADTDRKECPDCEVSLERISREGDVWCPECERSVWKEGNGWWGQSHDDPEPVSLPQDPNRPDDRARAEPQRLGPWILLAAVLLLTMFALALVGVSL